ncbi:hypothetical protein BKA82DRAFT_4178098 [Pisolithus tinctorius]|nr:hypothetical protein BKA82DRAFT_4178098 [Pisolithus tinctorius]
MFPFTPASINSEIKRRCSTMEPMANGPWVFGETEQNGESVTDEMQSHQVISPTVPESPDYGTDGYALFSVCIVQEPTGTVNNDSVRRQHLDTVVEMDAESQTNADLDLVQTPAPANKIKLRRPVESTPAPVRQLDWSTFKEDDSYLGEIPQEWTRPMAAQPQVDSGSTMGEPHVVSPEKGKGHEIEDGGAVKAYEDDIPFTLPHGGSDDDPMIIIREQQAIINSLRKENLCNKARMGSSGLRPEQKENIEAVNLLDFMNDKTHKGPTLPNKKKEYADISSCRTTPLACATSVFPYQSMLLRAMHGDPDDNDPDSSDPGSGGREGPSSRGPPHRPIAPRDSSDSSSSTDDSSSSDGLSLFGSDFLGEEPSSMITADSDQTKAWKHEKKYQQAFLKEDPPFTYKGEVQVGLFKKWCQELCDWSIHIARKYLSGHAYQFYERDILDFRKQYSLTEFFEALFDYIFPADFQMQQCDKFDACHQDHCSVLDFLH